VKKFVLLCSTAAFVMPAAAYAQSTGTVDFEEEAIVVTGTRTRDVGGVQIPDAPKAKAVLTQEMISRTGPGQTVLDAINVLPGVSFQNNDAYGNSGGTLSVRGFDSTRVSYTLDGIQLNDSGNYNIYSNFSIDPELIEQVNVSLGSTDVDSPTASAVGGTINQRTRTPSETMGGLVNLSLGEFDYRRAFGMFDFGTFTPWGTRAFVAASTSKYDNPYNNYGKLDRQQYNAKIWQPVGANGDFVSVAARYNQDRNNFFGSLPLRWDEDREVGSGSSNRFPRNNDEREYDIEYPCLVDQPQAGAQDFTNTCGTQFDRRWNPSNSISIRGNSRFSITDQLILTVDPSYQYTKANGGGTVVGREGTRIIDGVEYTGFIGGQYYFGRDLNGDGDVLDTCSTTGGSCSSSNFAGVNLLAPSQTRTKRYAVIAGIRYEINDQHNVRFTYTHDQSNHRQTGQVGFLKENGEPVDVFPVNDPIEDANGNVVQKRDRQSYAILNQVAAEYRGATSRTTASRPPPTASSTASGKIRSLRKHMPRSSLTSRDRSVVFSATRSCFRRSARCTTSRRKSPASLATPRTFPSPARTICTMPSSSLPTKTAQSRAPRRPTPSMRASATPAAVSRLSWPAGSPSSMIGWPRLSIRNWTEPCTGTSAVWISGGLMGRSLMSRSAS
jgi:iron complex outermembrane receptor protein